MKYLSMMCLMISIMAVGCCERVSECENEFPTDRLFPVPSIDFAPRHYLCYRTSDQVKVDGWMNEDDWQMAPWTEVFVDIEGDSKPLPRFETRAKMLWDVEYFYIAVWMEEPHVWGTLTERDAVIFHDNDFEVFIDPDGDTHEYYELEINALGTEWDLFLTKPYRDNGSAINSWDIQGLRTAIAVEGTVNDPGDQDGGWGIEIAIPWSVLAQCAHKPAPPDDGDQWRVNFSRVEWRADEVDGKYIKSIDSTTGKSYPEDNWVWSPQGLIAMHYPEMWGYVQFSTETVGENQSRFVPLPEEKAKWMLRKLYYLQREHNAQYGSYTTCSNWLFDENKSIEGYLWPPVVEVTSEQFEIRLEATDGDHVWVISADGNVRRVAMTR